MLAKGFITAKTFAVMYLRILTILVLSFQLGCSGDEINKHANSEDRNTHPLNSDSFWVLSKEPDLIIHSSNNDSGVQLYRASDGSRHV